MHDVARGLLDRRALGLALTRIANAKASEPFATDLAPPAKRARRIGLTGAPGAGKSTLAGRLALERLPAGRIGVLAIDPSSPRTGGAILGDRIRMDDLAGSENLYIRSFASRSASDGLADNLPELLDAMDRFDFDEVLVETVGVGQAELAVRAQVDTLILVVPPDAGDAVQTMKAGIIEIADIFAVNKADMPAAMKMATELRRVIGLTQAAAPEWVPPVLLTSRTRPESIAELSCECDRHRVWLESSGLDEARRLARRKYRLLRWLERRLGEVADAQSAEFFDLPAAEQLKTLLIKIAE